MEDMKATTPEELAHQQSIQPATQSLSPLQGGAMSSEVARSVAEIQTAMTVAQMCPRSETKAWSEMKRACGRITLADQALYAYKRGDKMVSGPTIRLAEVLARCFRNIDYGFRELESQDGKSRVEAYAWDLEANVRVKREFWVKHIREKRSGDQALKGQRDVYEMVASQAQRRVRACLLEIVPGDFVEAAQNVCQKTLEEGDGRPLKDRIRDAVLAFEEVGVTEQMLEGYLQHPMKATIAAELPRLQQVYNGLNSGMVKREEVFDVFADVKPKTPPKQPTTPKKTKPNKDKAKPEKAQDSADKGSDSKKTTSANQKKNTPPTETPKETVPNAHEPMSEQEKKEIEEQEKAEYEQAQREQEMDVTSPEPSDSSGDSGQGDLLKRNERF
jgi:hypothetical protein